MIAPPRNRPQCCIHDVSASAPDPEPIMGKFMTGLKTWLPNIRSTEDRRSEAGRISLVAYREHRMVRLFLAFLCSFVLALQVLVIVGCGGSTSMTTTASGGGNSPGSGGGSGSG